LSAIAQRYAAALADVTLERKSSEAARRGLAAFVEVFFGSADLRNVLESPAVNREVKRKVLEALAAKMAMDEAVRNLVLLLVDNRRTELLREVEKAFAEELNARLGIAQAEVTSLRGLDDTEKEELTAALERLTGKKIEARFQQDKALVGGVVVRVGSTVYDGSLREQLNRLRERLEAE